MDDNETEYHGVGCINPDGHYGYEMMDSGSLYSTGHRWYSTDVKSDTVAKVLDAHHNQVEGGNGKSDVLKNEHSREFAWVTHDFL